MRPIATGVALAALLAVPGLAQGPVPDATTQDDLEQRFVALEDEYDDAYYEWRQEYSARIAEYRAARESGEDVTFEMPPRIEPAFYPRFATLADEGVGRAQLWCLVNHGSSGLEGEAARADKLARYLDVLSNHADAEWLGDLVRPLAGDAGGRGPLGRETSFALLDLLKSVAAEDDVKAACDYTKVSVDDTRGRGTEEELRATLAGYEAVADAWPETSYGKRAAGLVFKQERLQIGMVAPDFEGTDVDGNPLRLSDFRGKVVVIDFWGFW